MSLVKQKQLKLGQIPLSPPNQRPPPPPSGIKKSFIFSAENKHETEEPLTANGGVLQVHHSVDQSA